VATFDPVGILAALERHRVSYVVVGELAGVIHGSGMTTHALEITPSLKPENLGRLVGALTELGVTGPRTDPLAQLGPESEQLALATELGEVVVTPTPRGSRGYDDLRRAAQREPLGRAVRAPVASLPDLIRTIDAAAQPDQRQLERRLRRAAELYLSLPPGL
jgi:hypothetical protein